MRNSLLKQKSEIEEIRNLLSELGDDATIVDFEEHSQLGSVRETIRLWRKNGALVGFGYVDDFCNLWFETRPSSSFSQLEDEIITWGTHCIQQRNKATGEGNSLDYCCLSTNKRRKEVLLRNGFRQEPQRTLSFTRSLSVPIEKVSFPQGYSWRRVNKQDSVESLVSLHQAAFGTDHMTVEYRQAIMAAPHYRPELDLVALAPDGSLAAFCICGFEDADNRVGYSDPIGTHPGHQNKGLAKALVSAGMNLLAKSGARSVRLGTSSENIGMQKLAESLGFICEAEKLWFSKDV